MLLSLSLVMGNIVEFLYACSFF